MTSSTKQFRFPAQRSRGRRRYERSTESDGGNCPYQQLPSAAAAAATQQSSGRRLSSQCRCCLKKFTFLERILNLGQKRCSNCRATICKRCVTSVGGGRRQCDVCQVKWRGGAEGGAVGPEQLMALDANQLVSILHSLHYRDTEFVGWPRQHLVKQILTRLEIHCDWDPDALPADNQLTPGKSPKRRKRRPSRNESELKRARTNTSEFDADQRTIDLIDVINQQMESTTVAATSKKVEPESAVALPLPIPVQQPPPSQPQPPPSTASASQRRSVQRNSSITPRKLAANLRKSVSVGSPVKFNSRKRGSGVSLPIEDLCKICMDKVPNCVFLNCGHMVSCHKCAHLINECPICRSAIVKVQKVYKS